MKSIDPMRNFPELAGLPESLAKTLIGDTQKRVTREPKILLGLIATVAVAAYLLFGVLHPGGILGAALAGSLVGAAAVAYMAVVIRPRMRAAFREMGYPHAAG